jgi:hypothetical protein
VSQPRQDEAEAVGSADIEIPIGVPVSDEEVRRLKAAASRPRDGRADATQEDAARDD